MNKKIGFTLAEVLITLAIIGVVAALTLPTLLANYNKREWATRLIKTHAELTQGFKMMMAQDNVSSLSQTKAWSSIDSDTSCQEFNLLDSSCTSLRDEFTKTFPGSQFIDLKSYDYVIHMYLSGVDKRPGTNAILLNNGKALLFYANFFSPKKSSYDVKALGGNMDNWVARFSLDINGFNGPNTFGKDIFAMYLNDDGTITPKGSVDASIYAFGDRDHTWRGDVPEYACNSSVLDMAGEGCGARVLEEGKMDY